MNNKNIVYTGLIYPWFQVSTEGMPLLQDKGGTTLSSVRLRWVGLVSLILLSHWTWAAQGRMWSLAKLLLETETDHKEVNRGLLFTIFPINGRQVLPCRVICLSHVHVCHSIFWWSGGGRLVSYMSIKIYGKIACHCIKKFLNLNVAV